LAFLLFMVFQIETLNGQSHPVIVWGAYMLGWDLGSGLSFASDPVWNPINLFLVGMLAFSYYMMLMHAFEEPDEHEFEAIRFDERLLTKLVDTADAHWPADEFEEADEERAEADAQLHQSSIRVHTVY
jgi:hypothetical protein